MSDSSGRRLMRVLVVAAACGCAVFTADTRALAQPTNGAPVPTPPGYVIGPDDVLSITYWRQEDMSADVVVRPDGKISLPLLNEIQAAGLSPTELLAQILKRAERFVENPTATVVVKEVRSRKVFITGSVGKPGVYPLTQPTTVLQLIALAGGLTEWADSKSIVVVRLTPSGQRSFRFNYSDVSKSRNLSQNILLEPGDTVVVP